MLADFFLTLKRFKVPVSIREYLDLLSGLQQRLAFCDFDEFYALAKVCLVKDERYYDRFDLAMTAYFEGLAMVKADPLEQEIPEQWLRKQLEKSLSPEALKALQQFKDLDELMEAFKERLKQQKKRHQGGNRMVGTGGTSPFGAFGDHPSGFRLAGPARNKHAVKVWEQRRFKNLDDSMELGTRNLKVALRRLRKFARVGPKDKLDLGATIKSTAEKGGLLDIEWQAERRNAVKVLLFFDVGGSMDPYVQVCEELFSAARAEFKHMQYFYFHNFIYECVWTNALRRDEDRHGLWDIIHTYGKDYKVIFVGDAAMSPYEVSVPGGCLESWNEEPGEVWFNRLTDHFGKMIWINPENQSHWEWTTSTARIRQLLEGRMYPLTLDGLNEGIQALM